MTEYVKVKDGIIQSQVFDKLPSSIQLDDGSWLTGFDNSTPAKAAKYGYYKVVIPEVSYDKNTYDIRYTDVLVVNEEKKTVSPEWELVSKHVQSQDIQPVNINLQQLTLINGKIKDIGEI